MSRNNIFKILYITLWCKIYIQKSLYFIIMVKKFFFLFMSLVFCHDTFSQHAYTPLQSSRQHHQHSGYVRQYLDSLETCRLRCLYGADAAADSVPVREDADSTSCVSSLSVLYPLNFRYDVSRRLLSLDSANTGSEIIDQSLMTMYLLHPEHVLDAERNFTSKTPVTLTPESPMRNDLNITSQTTEQPIVIKPSEGMSSTVDLVAVKPNFWTFGGEYSLQFLQNYVSDNWYKGGESNYSMIGAVAVLANYNDKEKVKWENKLEMKLGMQSSQGDTLHNYKSSEDLIRLTSKLGIQAEKRWYYTLQAIASTQFTHGYKANDPFVYSDFMSPFTVNLSLGMDYKLSWFKNRLTGSVNISPLAVNMKYVDRLSLSTKYGIDEGKHTLWDFGSTFTTDLVYKISDMIKWQTRLYAYTTYKRAEVEWENTFTFQLSKYISTKVFVYPRFDDSSPSKKDSKYGYFQLKEYWSLGFNYSF